MIPEFGNVILTRATAVLRIFWEVDVSYNAKVNLRENPRISQDYYTRNNMVMADLLVRLKE